ESDICLARVETLPRDSKLARVEDYYDKIERLLNHQSLFDGLGAKGVIIFGSDQEVGDFMSAVRRLNCSDKFSWIGSDGWGARPLAYRDGNEKTVEGAVTVQPLAEPIVGFKEYFLSLRPDTNKRNPWFAEFWEDYFDCWLPDGPQTPYNQKHSEMCRPELRMSESDAKFVLEPQLQFVSDAVMAFAVALRVRWAALSKRGWLQSLSVSENHSHAKLPCKIFPQNLRIQLCRPGVSHPACLHRLATSGSELLVELKSVNFTGLSGMDVHFTPGNADGPPRYRILNFQADSESGYSWREVGRFDGARGGVQLEWSSLRFRGGASQPPVSACRPECSDSSIRQVSPGECSCWMCVHCPDYHVVDEERQHCILCKKGTRPSSDRTTCEPIDMEFLSFGHPVAAVAATLASLGVAASLFVLFEFARYRDSAVVQASGLELSLLLLLGLVVCYSATFLLCARPSNWLCGVQRFVVGFGVAVSSSALLVKTVRLERRFRTGRPGFEPLKQVLLFLLLVAVQLAALIGWLLLQPPKSVSHFPSRDRHQLVCSSLIGLLYLVGLAYPMLLVLLCTVCAFFARNIPDGFNETKHIGFTMYSSCVIWLGFVPCYALTGAFVHIRVATLCFAITLSATVTLACLFGPKLYIILLRPELNVRQAEQCGCQYPLQERQPEPEAKRLLSSQLQIDDCSQTGSKRSVPIGRDPNQDETRAENVETRAENVETRAENVEPRTENAETRAENVETRAENVETRAENVEPRTENAETRAENVETRARVIIIGSVQGVGDLVSAVQRLNGSNRFSWIGDSGCWGIPPKPYGDARDEAIKGAVTVQPLAKHIFGFKKYFVGLRPDTKTRNPWFAEFWEDYFDCWLPDGLQTPYNQKHSEMCRPELRMSEPQLQFVSDAVMAFAVALRVRRAVIAGTVREAVIAGTVREAVIAGTVREAVLYNRFCTAGLPRPDCLRRLSTSGPELLAALQSITFESHTGGDFSFTPDSRDGPPLYRILNFQYNGEQLTRSYRWREVARFLAPGCQLRFCDGGSTPPKSDCQPECPPRSRQAANPRGVGCECWLCVRCAENQVLSEDKQQCNTCPAGTRLSEILNRCEPTEEVRGIHAFRAASGGQSSPEENAPDSRARRRKKPKEQYNRKLMVILTHGCSRRISPRGGGTQHSHCIRVVTVSPASQELLTFSHPAAIAAVALASLGVAASLFAIGVFVWHRDSAVVRASGLELSLLLLLGLVLCYSATFLLCARPSNWLCSIQRFVVGFGVAVSSSALLVKTVRSALSTGVQMVTFGLLVSVQLAALTVWLMLQPPQ
uniref:G_PROTEIN_RECEP_F3_4 domain-containing protein n=1 Tax=Macrostomum lignano TaxID=282301 RepID=A0A1I8IHE0_9PLAT